MLNTMGITDVIDPNTADFSGITGNHDLSISTAIHQAYVKVDEKGTEAAAATGAVFQTTSVLLSKHTFRADHPFVFMIYDKQTDLVLFLGQVTDPTA
jgi:serpin B